MTKIEQYRRRLADLGVEEIEAGSATPATTLAACRVLESRLRQLKRDVLAEVTALRDRAEGRGARSRKRLSQEGARKLLKDVHDRVTGFLDNRDAATVVGEWSEISREIDARLARLAELELGLVRAARRETPGEDADDDLYAAAAARPRDRPEVASRESGGDDFYAAVGAVAQKGEAHDAYCPHCGRGVEADDRFCRKCGHRLE